MRDPTDVEIDVVDGGAKTVGCVEHANETYGEVLTKKPQYVAYLTTEDQRRRYESKKFINWARRQKIGNS